MIIIRMCCGLGNQLFLYGMYEKMRSLGKETYIYLDSASYANPNNPTSTYQLPLLNLNPAELPVSEHFMRYLSSRKLYHRVLRRLDRRIYFEKEDGMFDPKVLRRDNAILLGFFQTEKYLEDVSEVIRSKIHFEGSDDPAYSEILEKMSEENSVSIHVRLTDYLKNKNVFEPIYDSDYYQKAIEIMKEKVPNPVFYLFSDDLDAAKKILSGYDVIPVSFNRGSKSYLDMFLMSQCKHNIIANSSFSWWGAWLNSYHDKIVIAPKRWLKTARMLDICPENWIRVGGEGIG